MNARSDLRINTLARDPSAQQASNSGLLRRAENVTIRAAGVAESRPNVELLLEKTSTNLRVRALREFMGHCLAVETNSGSGAWTVRDVTADTDIPGIDSSLYTPVSYDAAEPDFAEARGNLYMTASTGPAVIENTSVLVAANGRRAGVEMVVFTDMAATTPGVAYTWAYRWVFVKKDSNGYERRSPPSARLLIGSSANAIAASATRVYFPKNGPFPLVKGDVVEMYRTRIVSGTAPGTEYFLCQSYALGASDITNGYYVPPADALPDDSLGVALYTNASQNGAISAKYSPPQAKSIAWFDRCMWYGNTASKNRQGLQLTKYCYAQNITGIGIFSGGTKGGLTFYDDDHAVFTSDSAVVTGLADTSYLVAGMAISDNLTTGPFVAGTAVQSDARILTVDSPTQITMTKTATSSSTRRVYIGDVVTVQGVDFYCWSLGSGGPYYQLPAAPWNFTEPSRAFSIGSQTTGSVAASVQSATIQLILRNLCAAMNWYALNNTSFTVKGVFELSPTQIDTPGNATCALEEIGMGGASFSVSTSRPGAFSPMPSVTSLNDAAANRLYWSDIDEPESVPVLNYVSVGTSNGSILRLVPLRNALLVFKTDGVYRVSGSAPSSWSVECLDPTINLLRPEAVAAFDNQAFAWTTQGIFAVSEMGARGLSRGLIDVELRQVAKLITDDATTHATFVVPWQQRQTVLFGVPITYGATAQFIGTGRVYAYNLSTEAWSEWMVGWQFACPSAKNDRIYVSRPERASSSGINAVVYEVRQAVDDPRGYDRVYSAMASVVWSSDRLSFTVPASSIGTWYPLVGDVITGLVVDTFSYRRITGASYSSGTGLWTITLESAMPAGVYTASAQEQAIVRLEWHPTAASTVPVGSFVRELQLELDARDFATLPSVDFPTAWKVGGTPETSTTTYTVTSTRSRVSNQQPIRVGASRQIARAAWMAPYVEIDEIAAMRINGIAVVYNDQSERTRR